MYIRRTLIVFITNNTALCMLKQTSHVQHFADSQSHHEQQPPSQSSQVMTIGVKVFSPANKKEFKMYTLRNVHTTDFNDPTSLKTELFTQLGDEVVCGTLDFGVK